MNTFREKRAPSRLFRTRSSRPGPCRGVRAFSFQGRSHDGPRVVAGAPAVRRLSRGPIAGVFEHHGHEDPSAGDGRDVRRSHASCSEDAGQFVALALEHNLDGIVIDADRRAAALQRRSHRGGPTDEGRTTDARPTARRLAPRSGRPGGIAIASIACAAASGVGTSGRIGRAVRRHVPGSFHVTAIAGRGDRGDVWQRSRQR